MTQDAQELVARYDLDAELVEALVARYGADLDRPSPAQLDDEPQRVYESLDADGESPARTLEDHFYQFERESAADSPGTEAAFRAVVDDLVDRGLVARTTTDPPRYSTSFYETLREVGPSFTASGVDRLCADTGMDKRTVYYHILTDLSLDLDVTR